MFVQRSPVGGTATVAWPRPTGFNHLPLIIASSPGDSSEEQEQTPRQITLDAPGLILGDDVGLAMINSGGSEPNHDIRKVNHSSLSRRIVFNDAFA